MDQKLDVVLGLGQMSPRARSVLPGSWETPAEVALDEAAGLLCWRGELQPVRPRSSLVRQFLNIWDADNATILRFAEQWGPLWLCDEHKLPIMHRWMDSAELARTLAAGGPVPDCSVRKISNGWYGEPLKVWRHLSVEAAHIVGAGRYARRGELPFAVEDDLLAALLGLPKNTPPLEIRAAYLRRLLSTEREWASLGEARNAIEVGNPEDLPDALADIIIGQIRDAIGSKKQFAKTLRQPDALARKVNQWIEDGGGFRQTAAWRNGQPVWQEDVRSLYAAIGVGLWNVIGNMTLDRKCEHCGQVFTPSKSSQKYCKACGKRVRNRLSQRRTRANKATQARSS